MSENETPDVEVDEIEQEPQEAEPQEVDSDTPLEEIPKEDAWEPKRALAKIRKLNAEIVKANKRMEEAKTEGQKQHESLAAENLRLRVGLSHGLPENLVRRLNGSTEEELIADAKELMEMFESKAPPSDQPKERLRQRAQAPAVDELNDLDKFSEAVFRR